MHNPRTRHKKPQILPHYTNSPPPSPTPSLSSLGKQMKAWNLLALNPLQLFALFGALAQKQIQLLIKKFQPSSQFTSTV
jgi:hypothetical protein